MNWRSCHRRQRRVSAGCHINDVMNMLNICGCRVVVSAGCHINDVMNTLDVATVFPVVSAGCHINDVTKCVN